MLRSEDPADGVAVPDQAHAGARALALVAGQAAQLDAVVEHVVAPALARLEPGPAAFTRRPGPDGAHVELVVAQADDHEQLEADLQERLTRAAEVPARGHLLPFPASWRTPATAALRDLGPVALPADADVEACAVVLSVLPELEDGAARCAFGLAAAVTLARAGGPDAGPGTWEELLARSLGDQPALRARLTQRAGRHAPALLSGACALREGGRTGIGLRRLAELEAAEPLVTRVHLTLNRLGLHPLEEALVALLLAGEAAPATGSSPTRTPKPEVPPADATPTADGASTTDEVPAADEAPAPPAPEAPVAEVVVHLAAVTKHQEDEPVLQDVSFDVHAGEVLALLGPERSGKSDLLGVIAGLRLFSTGEAQVLGRSPSDVRTDPERAPALVLPDEDLAGHLTVRENVKLRLRDGGDGAVDGALQQSGLVEDAGTPVRDLGPGARRRTAIACALALEPSVLLLDEPTLGLDPIDRDEVWRAVARRREAGGTTVVATAAVEEARALADRVARLADGAVTSLGPADAATEDIASEELVFRVTERPDRALLEELPEVEAVDVDERPDHWVVRLQVAQPERVLALLEADDDFPEVHRVPDDADDGDEPEPDPEDLDHERSAA